MSNDRKSGLFNKYIIKKVDGGEIDPDAQYFVLRLDNDRHAQVAAFTYALSCKADNRQLADQLVHLVVQKAMMFIGGFPILDIINLLEVSDARFETQKETKLITLKTSDGRAAELAAFVYAFSKWGDDNEVLEKLIPRISGEEESAADFSVLIELSVETINLINRKIAELIKHWRS